LLYALLSGLKPKLASFVLARNPQTFVDAVDSARIVEYSIVDSGPDDQLTGQMAELRKDIQRLAQRYDSSPSLSAAIQNNSSPIPARRVTFQQPRGQANRGRVFAHPLGQNMRFSAQKINSRSFFVVKPLDVAGEIGFFSPPRIVSSPRYSRILRRDVANVAARSMQMCYTAPQ